jgi:hypothetical protein
MMVPPEYDYLLHLLGISCPINPVVEIDFFLHRGGHLDFATLDRLEDASIEFLPNVPPTIE